MSQAVFKVAIVGKSPSSRHLAPFDDPTWQIWSLGNSFTFVPRWDRWYELHAFDRFRKEDPKLVEWMQQQPADISTRRAIYLQEPQADIGASKRYPKEQIIERYGTYFTNTISWMIAHALLDGVQVLGLWGVDMATDTEYAGQRPSCEFLLGWARGQGVDVVIPPESDLLKCRGLYGFEGRHGGEFSRRLKAKRDELTTRRDEQYKLQQQNLIEAATLDGRRSAFDEVEHGLNGQGPKWIPEAVDKCQAAFETAQARAREHERNCCVLQGAIENIHWVRQWG